MGLKLMHLAGYRTDKAPKTFALLDSASAHGGGGGGDDRDGDGVSGLFSALAGEFGSEFRSEFGSESRVGMASAACSACWRVWVVLRWAVVCVCGFHVVNSGVNSGANSGANS